MTVADDDAVARLLDELDHHRPVGPHEAWSLRRTRALVAWLPRPFDETADAMHVTGSAIVVDDAGRVALHRHKRLGIWLQPGGHVDPGESPADAARREATEETGLHVRHPADGPRLLHVDVHPGPRGHLHLDLRYLLHAEGDQPFAPAADESPDVAWFDRDAAIAVGDLGLAEAVRATDRPA